MKIGWHHIKYAAAHSWRLLAIFAILFAINLAATKGIDLITLIVAISIGAAVASTGFLYYLWRTQRRMPMTHKKSRRRWN